MGMNEKKEPSESDLIISRHMARLLTELEDAGCPLIFREAVKSKLRWMRSDLNEMKDGNLNEPTHKAFQ